MTVVYNVWLLTAAHFVHVLWSEQRTHFSVLLLSCWILFFSIFLVVSGRPCSFLKKKHQMHFQNCAPSLHFLFNKIFWLLVWAKCVVMPFVCVANTRQLLTFLIWPLPLKIPTYLYTELNLILRCTARISRKMAFLSIPLIRRLLGIHAGYDQCW